MAFVIRYEPGDVSGRPAQSSHKGVGGLLRRFWGAYLRKQRLDNEGERRHARPVGVFVALLHS
jgi:hypothetical protein